MFAYGLSDKTLTGNLAGDWVLGLMLLAIGLVLAFMGEDIWHAIMGLIGAVIGGAIGYVIGLVVFPHNWWMPLIAGVVCAIIGSILFGWLVKVAMAVLVGVMGAGVAWLLLHNALVAFVVFVIIAILAYFFMDQIIKVLTAMVGGILAGAGMYLLLGVWWLALVIGILAFVGGAAYQLFVDRD